MKRVAFISIIALIIGGNFQVFGQGATKAEKMAFAARLSEEFKRKKEEAIKIALEKGWPVRVEYSDHRIMEIVEIGPNGFPEYYITENEDAAATTSTNELWSGGSTGLNLTGSGFTVAEWDGAGVRTTHNEFRVGAGASRVIQKDVPGGTSYHSTHVAGTMIAEGEEPGAQGMAPQANLHAYDWDDDIAEMLNANAVDNIILSNHSYGLTRGWDEDDYGNAWWFGDTTISGWEDYQFGFYCQTTKTWDSAAYVMPEYLIVKSAGNDRNDSHVGGHYVFNPLTGGGTWSTTPRDEDGGADGYDCIGNYGVAKNVLTVGACEDIPGGWTQASDVVISEFSSYGPADDGRIKPDIVGNGVNLYSCIDASNSSYFDLSGTSMSAPNVTGTLALLQQYYYPLNGNTYMKADELKALVINSANEAGTADGPDYRFGWGLLNATGMARTIHEDDSLGSKIRRQYLSNGEVELYTYYSDGNTPINVTICWIDPPHAALAPALNPATICLVNDLDIRIITPQGSTAYPWRLNPLSPSTAAVRSDNFRDNVEKITIDNPVPGKYTIQVSHKGAISGQYYAMVISGLQTQRFTNEWTGGDDTDYWYENGNWSLGHDPVVDEIAVIPAGSSFHPVVDVADGTCYSLNAGNDVLLEIRDNALTIDQDLFMYGDLEMDNSAGVLTIGDAAYWYNGSSADIQANALICVYGNWYFNSGTNVNMTNGRVLFTGTGPSLVYTYDSDASFYSFGNYKSGGGYVEHSSLSLTPLRTNDYFYLHYNSEFRTSSSQSIIIEGFLSKTASAICNLNMGTIVLDGTSTTINFDAPGYFNNLTISPSTSVTLLDNIDVNGDLLIEQGTLVANNHRINIAGDWNNTVGDTGFNEAGSRVIFDQADGPSSYIYSGENFDTLDIQIFDQVIMTGLAAPVTCDHFIFTGGGLNVTNSTITIDDLVQSGIYGYWYVNTGATVNMYQDAAQYIDLWGSMNISGGTVNIYGGLDESYWGAFATSSFSMSSGIIDFVNKGVVIYNSYPFTETITGGTIRVATEFTAARTDFNPTGGTIEFRSTNDGYLSHDAGSNFYNILVNKFTSPLESVYPGNVHTDESRVSDYTAPPWQVELHNMKEKKPANSRSTIVYLESNLDINGNLTIDEGILDVSTSDYSINIAGDWTNNVDITGFNEQSGKVTFDGALAKDINTTETFFILVLDKTFASYYGLELDGGMIVYVTDSLNIKDGTLEMNTSSILDCNGHLTISAGAGLNADDPSVSIRLAGNFTDMNVAMTSTTGFYPGYYSTLLLDGTVNQIFQTLTSTGVINNLTIDKSSSVFYPYDNIELRGDLNVITGSWADFYGVMSHQFRGDFTVNSGADFYTGAGSICNFIGSADQVITFDPALTGGYFRNLIIDKSVAKDGENGGRDDRANLVTMATDVECLGDGNLTVNYGTLDFNGKYLRLFGDVKINNGGKITIDDDAWLEVGGSDSVIVYSGGVLEVVGSVGHEASIKGYSNLYYTFEVRSGGTINARYAIFEETGTEGLYIQSGGLIDAANDFDYCTFTNGQAAANALLRIDNNQTLTIENAGFPTSFTTKNVSKTLNQGKVTLTGSTGAFAGPAYENDANGRIHWSEHGLWEGTVSTDWNTAANWGFDLVPTSAVDVVIPAGCPNYPVLTNPLGINTAVYIYDCRSLTVETGGKLTISGGYDLVNYGNITTSGDLIIGDDYYGYTGSVFNITADTCRFGVNSSNGYLYLNSGGEINMPGGVIMAETYYLYDGCWLHCSGGAAHLSRIGTGPATAYIYCNDGDSYFYNLNIDPEVSASMNTSLYDLNVNYIFTVNGTFTNFGKTVTANYMDVYGVVNLDSGLVTVMNNGPYFQEGSDFHMTGGTLDAGNQILWDNYSSGDISGGVIYGESYFTVTSNVTLSIGLGNTLYFNNTGSSTLNIHIPDLAFGTIDIAKPAGAGSDTYLSSSCLYPVIVGGNLYLRNGNQFHLQGEDLTVMGALINEAGSEMDMATGADFIHNGDYTLNGSLTNSGGNVTIHGRLTQNTTGVLTQSAGTFVNDKTYELPFTSMDGTMNLSGGTFEITKMVTNFSSTFIDNITGGTMRFGATFIAADNTFQPSGGTVELINFSLSGYPYIQIGTVNYLQNLTVSSNVLWLISGGGAAQLTIWQDLTINSGGLNGSDDIIYIGDDWTNNVGNSGFVSGSGSVYLNGTVAPPERQIISGINTFNTLYNLNVAAPVEFAGPTTINSTYYAAQGGSGCASLITGTPVAIQILRLPQGTFSLSASAPIVTATAIYQGGTVQVTDGNFTANDLAESYIGGTYTIYNGVINLNQDPGGFLDLNGNLNIYGGIVNVAGGQDNSYWPYLSTGSITMNAGILDFQSVGIILNTGTFTENITGGLIRTVGIFQANTGVSFFTPSGGAVELYGEEFTMLTMNNDCYFHDLYLSKVPPAQALLNTNLTVKGELKLNSSYFNTGPYLLNVGE